MGRLRHVRLRLCLCTLLVLAPSALAEVKTKILPAEKIFVYLANYYALPASGRSHFKMTFTLVSKDGKPGHPNLSLNDHGKSVPIEVDSEGMLSPLPTDAQLKDKATVTVVNSSDRSSGVILGVSPEATPALTMSTNDLNAAISEAGAGAKSMAGIMAVTLPKLDRLAITGSKSGRVRLANGEEKPLPMERAFVDPAGNSHAARLIYVPTNWPTAQTLVFDSVPTHLIILPSQ